MFKIKLLKLLKIQSALIFLVILSGCAKKSYKEVSLYNLPEKPLAGEKVANELEKICDDKKCYHLNEWLNDLYLFKQQYALYRYAINNKGV